MYLASIWDLWSLMEPYGIFSCGMWDLVLWSGIEPRPLHWEGGLLATGPQGKSLVILILLSYICHGASLVAQLVKNPLQCRRPQFFSWVGNIPRRRDRLPTPVFLGFPCGSDSKESTCNVGDLGSIPGLGRSPRAGHGNPLHYS